MKPIQAIYAGSFDPVTNGHMDIITRGAALFDKLVIGVGRNLGKEGTFTIDERIEMLRECTSSLKNISVQAFSGLLVQFAHTNQCRIIIRGLRALTDFDYEFQIGLTNMDMDPKIETIFLLTSPKNIFISSSMVKELASNGGEVMNYVPQQVIARVLQKFNRIA